MEDTLLITVLLVIVIALLILDIVVAVLAIKLLKTLGRAARLIEAIIDDVENFTKIFQKIKLPLSFGRMLKKLVRYLPSNPDDEKTD